MVGDCVTYKVSNVCISYIMIISIKIRYIKDKMNFVSTYFHKCHYYFNKSYNIINNKRNHL